MVGKYLAPQQLCLCLTQLLHDPVTLYRYKVSSIITSRLADTSIEVLLINSSPDSQIALFEVQIPKGAFISNFSM